MERRRQSAVYSPGGCGCGLLLLPVIAVSIGVMFALAGLAAAALVLFRRRFTLTDDRAAEISAALHREETQNG